MTETYEDSIKEVKTLIIDFLSGEMNACLTVMQEGPVLTIFFYAIKQEFSIKFYIIKYKKEFKSMTAQIAKSYFK